MVTRPIFVLDTNVFIHAANCKGYDTDPDDARRAQLIVNYLIEKCYPMLFSEETLNELKWQLKKLSFNAEFIGYDISKILRQNVFGVKKNNLPKDHRVRINSKKDELEEIISDPSDRKFVYLLRDYPYIAGEKYLVTSDSTFFPNDQELKKRLIEYSSKYEFSILSLYDFIKKFFPD